MTERIRAFAYEPELLSGEVVALRPVRSLDELARAFHHEHGQVAEAAVRTVEHAISAGEALIEAKGQVPHGEWQRWLAENILGEGRMLSTVNAYMRFARHQAYLRSEQPTTFKAAAALLRGSPDTRIDQAVVDDARRLRTEGLTYKQIGEQLGISKAAVGRRLNPETYRQARKRQHREAMAAKVALRRAEREELVRASSGSLAEAYSLIRRALQQLDAASGEADDRDVRRHISSAIHRLHNVEDEIANAVRLS